MTDLQKVQFELLKKFIEVCDKNNLTYFLVGGTALGAVRHKGFIPWDDDIDVGMPREDFEKFVLLQKEFDEKNYFIQTWKTDPCFVYNYAKLRDSNTTFIEDHFANHRINHGAWIDIFPIDACPDVSKNPKKFRKHVLWTWKQVFLSYLWGLRRKIHRRTFFKDIGLNIVAGLFFWGNIGHYRNKKVDKKLTKIPYSTALFLGNWLGTNPKKEAMDRNIFDGVSKATFEGLEVNLPKDYDKYLSNLYGDYMTPPPADKQIGHHHDKGLDLTKSYLDYMKEHKK